MGTCRPVLEGDKTKKRRPAFSLAFVLVFCGPAATQTFTQKVAEAYKAKAKAYKAKTKAYEAAASAAAVT